LASVLVHSGVETDPQSLVPQVYLPGRQGSLAVEMMAASRRQARLPLLVRGDLGGLWEHLAHDRPVLVFQNLGLSWLPRWHYAVLTGWDAASQEWGLHSGTQSHLRMQSTPFHNTWVRAGQWAMVVYKPGDLPTDSADDGAYLLELTRLEKLGQAQAARAGYLALLPRMPTSPVPGFALGNLAYQAGDWAQAEARWREVLGRHPRHAPTLNNLAEALLTQARAAEALPLAQLAAQIDARPAILDTLARALAAQAVSANP
jgi:tetratricopeptide (TPR) repeat protein